MDQLERIDKYLDKQLPPEEVSQLENELQQDTELRDLMERLQMARQAVRSGALRADIRRMHQKYIAEVRQETDNPDEEVENPDDGRVIPLPTVPRRRTPDWTIRIAASVALMVLAFGTYLYSNLSTNALYNAKYVQYQLPTTRDINKTLNRLDSLYLAGNYAAITGQFDKQEDKTPRDFFLTGMAYLQQKQYDNAIRLFTALRQDNTRNFKSYFEQETDYYLALAYLGAGRIDEAETLFGKIRQTPRHLYHRNVKDSDMFKLKLLKMKQ